MRPITHGHVMMPSHTNKAHWKVSYQLTILKIRKDYKDIRVSKPPLLYSLCWVCVYIYKKHHIRSLKSVGWLFAAPSSRSTYNYSTPSEYKLDITNVKTNRPQNQTEGIDIYILFLLSLTIVRLFPFLFLFFFFFFLSVIEKSSRNRR